MALNTTSRPSGESAMAVRLGRTDPIEATSRSAGSTLICRCVTGGGDWGLVRTSHSAATAATAHAAATNHGSLPGAAGDPPISSCAPLSRSSIWTRASPIACSRRFGSFSRHRRSSRRSPKGAGAGNASQWGSFIMTDASVMELSSPAKARRPVSISYSTHPNAQMSVRLSTACPRACSGLM